MSPSEPPRPTMPRLSKVVLAGFVGLVSTVLLAGAVLNPHGGTGLAYWIAPGGLAMAAFGVLALTNYRGTADAICDWQRALRPSRSRLDPSLRATFNRAAGAFFILFGLFIAIAGPIMA